MFLQAPLFVCDSIIAEGFFPPNYLQLHIGHAEAISCFFNAAQVKTANVITFCKTDKKIY